MSTREESEHRFATVFRLSPMGMAIFSADDGRFVDVNEAFVTQTGYSRDELIGHTAMELGMYDQKQRSLIQQYLQRENRLEPIELAVRRKSGETTIALSTTAEIQFDGKRHFLSLAIDITARKRAEEQLRKLSRAVEQSPASVVITDRDAHIEYVNPKFCEVTGYTREEVLGQNPRILKSGDTSPAEYEELWKALTTGGQWHGELHNRRKDGKLFWELATISAVTGDDGEITHYLAVKEDITARKMLEESLLQAQKMEAIGRLAGGVAHDFNNLLSVILAYTGFVMDAVPDNASARADLLEVRNAAQRAVSLTRQLLAFSRKQVLQPIALDLNKIVSEDVKMFRRVLGEDVELVQSLSPGLGLTEADPGQIEQVLTNLLVNARDAMPGGGRVTITTANVEISEGHVVHKVMMRPGPYVLLQVSDNGCGMDEVTRSQIFEPFFTTKERGKGTGLGLATVYGIVKQTGGYIWVYSEPGLGATFKIYLPLVRGKGRSAATPAPVATPRATKGETILVVEDEEALRNVASRTLTSAGYKVLVAGDGAQALDVAATHPGPISLLVTDVIMPRMGGRALAVELAPLRPEMKVLYVSGYTDDAILRQGVLDAGTSFLPKPFTPIDLACKVREVLDRDRTESRTAATLLPAGERVA